MLTVKMGAIKEHPVRIHLPLREYLLLIIAPICPSEKAGVLLPLEGLSPVRCCASYLLKSDTQGYDQDEDSWVLEEDAKFVDDRSSSSHKADAFHF
jgi:hypothetical protein